MIKKEHNAFENLHIMTNQGVVVTSENQVIEVGTELDFVDLFITNNNKDTTSAFVGAP